LKTKILRRDLDRCGSGIREEDREKAQWKHGHELLCEQNRWVLARPRRVV